MRGSWFAGLPQPFARQLLAAGQIKQFGKGEVFVHASEPTGLWAVLQGSIALGRIAANGNEFIFHVARPGFWLGAFGIVTGRALDVVVSAVGEATLLSIPRAETERLVSADASYLAALSLLSMDRFARALDALEQTSRLSAVGRVAAKLVSIRSLDVETDSAAGAMPLAISQTALALMTSLSRQSVSSALHELARVGAISVGFKAIKIVDLERLESIAADSS